MVGMHSSVLVGLDVFLCLNQSYSKYDWCEITHHSVANLRSTLPSLLQGCLGRCNHSHNTIMIYDTLNYTHVIITTFPWLVKFNQFSCVIRWDAVLCWRWPPSWWSPRRSPWRPWPRSSAGWQTWVPWATRRCAEHGEFVIREPTNSDKGVARGDQGIPPNKIIDF